jgi:hypothetical protein
MPASQQKKENQAEAFNQQSYLLTFTQINLISTETCSEPAFKKGYQPRISTETSSEPVFKEQQHSFGVQPTKLSFNQQMQLKKQILFNLNHI